MTDLATLGLRIESHEVEVAEERLHGMANAADAAEAQTDQLAMAARRGQGAVAGMNAAMRQQQLVHRAAATQMGLTAHEGLNLSRQLADIGVSAAMGMNPLMILVQQGPQIAEVFQMAQMRGVGFNQALSGLMRPLGQVISRLGPLAVAGGAVAGAFGLMARDMNKAAEDIVADLGLTEDQLKALEESGESTAITMGDAFRGFGTTVKEVLQEAFGPQIEAALAAFNEFLDELTANTAREMKSILGFFIGGYEAIAATWRMLPAAVGDAAVSTANAVVTAIEWMLNRAREGINALIPAINAARMFIPGGQFIPTMTEIGEVNLGEVSNPYAGALTAMAGTAADAYAVGQSRADSLVDGFADRWAENTRASASARILEAAGEADAPDRSRGRQGVDEDAREMARAIERAQRFLGDLNEETAAIGLNAIERRMREIGAAAEAAAVYSQELADQITAAGTAWRERTEAFAVEEQLRGIRDMTGALEQEAEVLALERDLIGASNQERERQLAMLRAEIELRQRARDLFDQTGVVTDFVNTVDGQRFIEQAGQNAIDAAALADMQALHDALSSTFESAFREAMSGDWRGVLETVLSAILDRTLARMADDFANLFTRQQSGGGQGGIGSLISAGMSLFGMGSPDRGQGSLGGLNLGGDAVGKIVVEFREGEAFGGKVLEVVGPVIAQAGVGAAKGGAQLALKTAFSMNRNKLGR